MRLGRIAAHQQQHLGLVDVLQGVGGRAAAENGGQPGHRGAVTDAGAVVDVVGAHHGAHELLEEVALFIRAAAGRNPHDGRRAGVALDRREALGHHAEGFFPRGLAESGKA